MSQSNSAPTARGFVSTFLALPGVTHYPDIQAGVRRVATLPFQISQLTRPDRNQIQDDWATILCESVRNFGASGYRLNAMYLEFANIGDTPFEPPVTFERGDNASYYANLALTADQDYLRVPIQAQTLSSTDEDRFPSGDRLTNWGVSDGIAGVHGKPYTAADGSRLYAAALVASPDYADASQDLVFSRYYFPESQQLRKLEFAQLGISWPIQFT